MVERLPCPSNTSVSYNLYFFGVKKIKISKKKWQLKKKSWLSRENSFAFRRVIFISLQMRANNATARAGVLSAPVPRARNMQAQVLNARCPPTSSNEFENTKLPATLKLINLKTLTSPYSANNKRQLHLQPSFQVFSNVCSMHGQGF